jgi:hypothetical protein
LLLVPVVLAMSVPISYGQKDTGKPYGARDPQPCASRKLPAKGAPSAAQAAQYITCDREAIDGYGHLGQIGDLKVEVSKGHAFNVYMDSAPNIDVSQTVYGIRGSFKTAYCTAMKDGGVARKNCLTSDVPTAAGSCYKDNFGDWHCTLGGQQVNERNDMPPLK